MAKILIKGKVAVLDSCPFCGFDTATLRRPDTTTPVHSVGCDPCNAVVYGTTRTNAAEAWNRRPTRLAII